MGDAGGVPLFLYLEFSSGIVNKTIVTSNALGDKALNGFYNYRPGKTSGVHPFLYHKSMSSL